MDKIVITGSGHPLYAEFDRLYGASFPPFERRLPGHQQKAFSSPRYRLDAFAEGGRFAGFLSYWEFDSYVYVEHFAVDGGMRGRGVGSRILGAFLSETPKMILLEIDPPSDAVSIARLNFYARLGFVANGNVHVHPPYRSEFEGHGLAVLSRMRLLTEGEYEMFKRDLSAVVMAE